MSASTFNQLLQDEISRVAELHSVSASTLEEFAKFVIDNYKKKDPKSRKTRSTKLKPKKLSLTELKKEIFCHFNVDSLEKLKKSDRYQMAISGFGKINFSKTEDIEKIYRQVIGILPGEENEEGYGCINGVNIFKYDLPWRVFDLDPQKSTDEDIKLAYRNLSKIYHPDNSETGDAQIFDRLTTFYRSLTYKF